MRSIKIVSKHAVNDVMLVQQWLITPSINGNTSLSFRQMLLKQSNICY